MWKGWSSPPRERMGAVVAALASVMVAGARGKAGAAGVALDVTVGEDAGVVAALWVEEVPMQGRDVPVRSKDQMSAGGAFTAA